MAGNGNLPPGYDGLVHHRLPGHEWMGMGAGAVLELAGIKIAAEPEPELEVNMDQLVFPDENEDQLKLPDLVSL